MHAVGLEDDTGLIEVQRKQRPLPKLVDDLQPTSTNPNVTSQEDMQSAIDFVNIAALSFTRYSDEIARFEAHQLNCWSSHRWWRFL